MNTLEVYDSGLYKEYLSDYLNEKALHELQGLLEGVCLDNVVTEEEIKALCSWLDKHNEISTLKPYDLIYKHLEDIIEDNIVDDEEIKDLCWLAGRLNIWTEADLLITKSIRNLHGIFEGLMSDSELTDAEILALENWIIEHDFLKGTYPYDEIETLLTKTLQDRVVTEDEKEILKGFVRQFTSKNICSRDCDTEWEKLKKKYSIQGICATDPNIDFDNHVFCFTGESSRYSRTEIASLIQKAGGIYKNNITKKTNYLIVGCKGNECWAFCSYGRKIEQAMKYRKEGLAIQIIHEKDFWDCL